VARRRRKIVEAKLSAPENPKIERSIILAIKRPVAREFSVCFASSAFFAVNTNASIRLRALTRG
jgi:hypothetical protein